jgi:hypothetical protein
MAAPNPCKIRKKIENLLAKTEFQVYGIETEINKKHVKNRRQSQIENIKI